MFGLLAGLGLLGFLVVQSAKKNTGSANKGSPWLAYNTDRTQEFNTFRAMLADPYRYSIGDFALIVDYLASLGFTAEADMLADMALRAANESEMEIAKQKLGQPFYVERTQFLDQNPRIFRNLNVNVENAYPGAPFYPMPNPGTGGWPHQDFTGATVDPVAWQNMVTLQNQNRATMRKAGIDVPDIDAEMTEAARKVAES